MSVAILAAAAPLMSAIFTFQFVIMGAGGVVFGGGFIYIFI